MYSNNSLLNSVPVEPGLNTTPLSGPASNNITMRGNQITEYLPTAKKPSRNMVEASMKTLRFFRKVCRMMPFLLRIHNLSCRVDENQAKINVANLIRMKSHLRDPGAVDQNVYKGYEFLIQAEWHYCNREHLFKWLAPSDRFPQSQGYSYLEQQKLQGKSSFLKDFYKGNKPTDY